ncbi:MAG: fimbrillin family protein, partial [Duncaniella sp.]|nr:fimbrillin family protein [Duncaniella sp.]
MMLLSGCSDEYDFRTPGAQDEETAIIAIAGQIKQEMVSRANDDGFVDGDAIGVYIVDYEGENPGTLLAQGNRGDNVHFTFDEAAARWNPSFDLYWKDKHTRIDVYSYYPATSAVDNISEHQFAVLTDQNKGGDDGSMGGYEASDFLWGKVAGVEPTDKVIRIPLAHRMANARVTLVEGEGFDSGEWAETVKQVLVSNTIQTSIIDMNTGVVTPVGDVSDKSIIPARHGDEWRAIVVPQTIPAGTTLFTLSVGGMPYKFSKNEAFTYVAGKMSNFSIRVDKKLPEGQYALTLISESITAWENDLVSHDATSREYIVINSTPGGLRQAIADAGQDYRELQNLKITGSINDDDFVLMRLEMPRLKALNLKEVRIAAYSPGDSEGIIPQSALSD